MKRFCLLLLALFVLCFAASCSKSDTNPTVTPDEDVTTYRVMLSVGEGAAVLGDQVVDVKEGESVEFQVELDTGYVFKSVSAGIYDAEAGILTIENVQSKMSVTFFTEKVNYDTNESVPFRFYGEVNDFTNVSENEVRLGTRITATSESHDLIFLGWSFGKSVAQGGVAVSKDRTFEFTATPEVLRNGVLYLYANYMDDASRMLYYDANGGTIRTSSDNISNKTYYKAIISDEKLLVTLGDEYFSYCTSHSLFWDDGSFTRDGYVLVEYNTKPDGTGEGYSLGSKYYAKNSGGVETLYCIWKKATPVSEFSYEDYEYSCPVKSEYAPDWQNRGVIITGYTGTDSELVIPENINGKYVIAIAEGAFLNADFETLVLNKRIQKIEDGAFVGCSSLETIYYPDGLFSISNDAFDAASYSSLKNLYVNASIAPRYANSGEGAFSVKLSRLLENEGEDRIIVIGGSSVYEGLATEYMEALFGGDYRVINFGTTRTTHGLIYLEAMKHYATDSDLVIYAPENSIYMMGEGELYYKTLRDLESMNNFYRYIDISNYSNVFSAFAELNAYRYGRAETRYEGIVQKREGINKYGDQQDPKRTNMDYAYSQTTYTVTFNDRVNSKGYDPFLKNEDDYTHTPSDWQNEENPYWTNLSNENFTRLVNFAISEAKKSGADVVFAYCPVDEDDMIDEAKNLEWLAAYEALIAELYDFDTALGNAKTYIYDHKYIYDSAFHLNDYGRPYRTYSLYLDISSYLDRDEVFGMLELGTNFEGCIFESNTSGTPKYKVDFLK